MAQARLRPAPPGCEHAFVSMIVCVLYPRFELLAALGDRRALLSEPAALAPEAGREQVVGEVSAPGGGLWRRSRDGHGEALSRCPALNLVPPDPEGSRALWGRVLDRLEGIGAAVESDRSGVGCFEAKPIEGIHGGPSPGCSPPRAGRSGRGRGWERRPVASRAHAAALRARPRRRRRRPRGLRSERSWWRSVLRGSSWPRFRWPFCAPGPSSRRCPRSSSSWGSGPWASLPGSLAGTGGALRAPRPAGARPGPGRDTPARPATAGGAGPRAARPARGRLGPAARAGPRPARGPGARTARATGSLPAGAGHVGPLRDRRHLAAGGDPPPGQRRPGPDHAVARPEAGRAARPGGVAGARGRGLRTPGAGPGTAAGRGGKPSGAHGWARRCVRRVRRRASDAALRVLDVDPDSRIPERRAVLAPFPEWQTP